MKNKTRNNKRKPLLVVALVLMVALVFGMGAMTYSRYISTAEMDDGKTTATVAKWGYVVTINADDMFGKEYNNGTITTSATTNDVRAVVYYTGDNKLIVAPGTSGSMTITVNGKADVLAQLSITVNDSQDVSLKENGAAYNPIKWTLKDDDTAVSGVENVGLNTLVTQLGNYTSDVPAGTEYNNKTYTISWSWALDSDNHEYDDADTVLGLAAADKVSDASYSHNGKTYTEINTQLKLDLSVTIKQIQTSDTNP